MKTELPEVLPKLSSGHHDVEAERMACFMDAVAWLQGRPEDGDAPRCVHQVLRRAAIGANDGTDDRTRLELWKFAPRIIGTDTSDLPELEAKRLDVRLAIFAARYVQHLVRAQDRGVCTKAIEAAEAWADDPSEYAADAAANAAYAADANADDAAYAADANDAAAYAADAANAAYANAAARLTFFGALVNEYHRLRPGLPERVITDEEWVRLRDLLGVASR